MPDKLFLDFRRFLAQDKNRFVLCYTRTVEWFGERLYLLAVKLELLDDVKIDPSRSARG